MPRQQQATTPLVFQTETDVVIHFYPGRNRAPTQATRYVARGEDVFLPNGEKANRSAASLPLFESQRLYLPCMDEIETTSGAHLFAKIIHAIKGLSSRFKHWKRGITITSGNKAKDDKSTYNGYVINKSKCSLGQSTDISEFAKSNDAIHRNPQLNQKPRVYFGVSRGAAATFSALAEINMHQPVKLCVLEAPPSSISGLFKFYAERIFKSRSFGKWLYHTLSTVFLGKQHKTDKNSQPRGHVDRFPNHIPLLIISSKRDKVVPHENTIRLALRVAAKRAQALEQNKTDVAPVYFLQLDEVNHCKYATGIESDRLRYLHTFHAICRFHGLPHVKDFADRGEHDMQVASLLTPPYQSFIKMQTEFWNHKDTAQRSYFRAQAKQQAADALINQRALSIMSHSPLFAKKIDSHSQMGHLQSAIKPFS